MAAILAENHRSIASQLKRKFVIFRINDLHRFDDALAGSYAKVAV